MARKYDFISELYNRTCKTVVATPASWEAFLRSACYNYRLRFDEQLLVHAQRPDATAVLQIDDWNQKFGRWVNRGAHGIAVFEDADQRRQRLVHYFDISDTHPSRFSRRVPIWQMRDEYTAEVIDTLESTFGELNDKETLRPSMITAATHRKVIWQCKLGHEWTASVKSRTVNGTGCPYCSHNFVLPGFNDLASRFPEIAAEWSERNLPLTPDQVTAFKNIKVWWKCHLGHEWNTLISTRAGGSQCPYCSGIKLLKGFNDLKTKYPSLAAEWSEKNLSLTPDAVNEKSTKNVWWKCNTCGYEWKAVVKARVKGGMCPVCAERAVLQGYNDLGTTDPYLLSEWDYEKNSKWTPSNVSRNSMKVVWWKCGAGHSYRAKITDRTIEQKGCPQCEAEFQQALPQMLIMMYGAQNGITVKSNSDSELGMRLVAYLPELHCAVDIAGATVTEKREQSVKAHICQSNRLGYYLIKRTADASQMAAEIKTLFIRNHIYLHTDSEKDVQVLRERFLEWKYRNACKLNGKY